MSQVSASGGTVRPDRVSLRLLGRGLLRGWLAVGVLLVALPVEAQTPPPSSFADIVERIAPAVVNISTTKALRRGQNLPFPAPPPGSPFEDFFREFFDQDQDPEEAPRRTSSLGSGFVVDPQGYVVTNNHVIAEADEISVVFSDERSYAATLVGRDPKTDIALLKIETDEALPSVTFADSDSVRVGDWMIAIGNPFGLGSTVTAGIVSARSRDIRSGPYDDFLQVDAPINRGNSGGPSFNLDGEVIGINTAIFSPSGGNVGIGFAIPSNLALPVIESLKEDGRVKRGWLGVRIQTVTDEIAESLGLPSAEGALVASVTPGGPAEQAEIEPGDVILQFDGKTIDRMRGLPRIVAETPIGKQVEVDLWRRGERVTVQAELGELPDDDELAALTVEEPDANGLAQLDGLGLTVAQLSDELRARFELGEDAQGVVIVEVDETSAAGEENLRPGDVIVEVGQEEVNSPPEVQAKLNQARQDEKKSVLLLIDRQGDLRFVALRIAEG
ncbi:MAG: DegQ family serine endoprotease [Geminicoccaceae bacterium]|nr:DegQ family serine endoprotease [Geminicoccaceae bacterium]